MMTIQDLMNHARKESGVGNDIQLSAMIDAYAGESGLSRSEVKRTIKNLLRNPSYRI